MRLEVRCSELGSDDRDSHQNFTGHFIDGEESYQKPAAANVVRSLVLTERVDYIAKHFTEVPFARLTLRLRQDRGGLPPQAMITSLRETYARSRRRPFYPGGTFSLRGACRWR